MFFVHFSNFSHCIFRWRIIPLYLIFQCALLWEDKEGRPGRFAFHPPKVFHPPTEKYSAHQSIPTQKISNRYFQTTSIEYLQHPSFDSLIARKQSISQMFVIYSVPYDCPPKQVKIIYLKFCGKISSWWSCENIIMIWYS